VTKQNESHDLAGQYASIAVGAETILFGISLVLGLIIRSTLGPLLGYAVCILLEVSVVVLMSSV
jgi:hypothetical protein